MKYEKWLEYINIVDLNHNSPELLSYYLARDPDLSGYEHDNLIKYIYSKRRYEEICRNLSNSLSSEL